jgi:uncharacterized membrane protein
MSAHPPESPLDPDTVAKGPDAPLRGRLLGLDALRGLAVFLMMEQHMGVWLYRPPRGASMLSKPILVGFNALGGMAAPLFVTLAGVGSSLLIHKHLKTAPRPPRGAPLDATLVLRGLALMLFGALLNLLTPSWFSPGSWFVLHMMGAAIASAPLWRRLPNAALLGLAAATLLATVAIQNWLGTPVLLLNQRMADTGMPGGPLRLALVEGQFPIFPWLAMYLSGMVVGRWIAAGTPQRIRSLALVTFALGAGLALTYSAAHTYDILPWVRTGALTRLFRIRLGFYPASPPTILLLHTGVLVLISGVLQLAHRWPASPLSWMVCLGRTSLTLLIVHVVVFRELSRPIGLWRANNANTSLLIIFGWLLLSLLLSRLWQRIGYRYGAEWYLRKTGGA